MPAHEDPQRRYRRANLELWNAWTTIHEGSAFYDVEGFRAGRQRRAGRTLPVPGAR
ncbi:MAG TPA: hypothetical protein VJ787_04220 [Thermoleophilia bacterium]|nr:hypothetical protein [Thermoleophilia bacterium]